MGSISSKPAMIEDSSTQDLVYCCAVAKEKHGSIKLYHEENCSRYTPCQPMTFLQKSLDEGHLQLVSRHINNSYCQAACFE